MNLAGHCSIITGASLGLGFETAKQLVQNGANIMICARTAATLEDAQQKLLAYANKSQQVLAMQADVTEITHIEKLVDTALDKFGRLDSLIANAGVYGPKGPLEKTSWDDWLYAFDINLKGAVLPCKSVLSHFKNQRYGKIVILSGGGATKPIPYLSSYSASKAAVVRFAETLAHEVKEYGIDVNTVAPGALNTRFLDEVIAAGPENVGKFFYEQSLQQKENGGAPLEKGAALIRFLISKESDGITGKLISAIWDPWQSMNEYKDRLSTSDLYTLRRIGPSDRPKEWADVK